MQKIECPKCLRSFMWTDNMPVRGRCPNIDCNWEYDLHEEIRKSVERKSIPKDAIICPHCGKPISSKMTICENCGDVIIGSKFFTKERFFIIFASGVILLGIIYKLISIFRS